MSTTLKERLTPKNTEEIKPGLFIQERSKGNYRQVNPIVWKGKWRLKKQFSWKNLIWIAIILFIANSYVNDNEQLIEFYNTVHENPIRFCEQVINDLAVPTCTDWQRQHGFCLWGLDVTKVINGSSNSIP